MTTQLAPHEGYLGWKWNNKAKGHPQVEVYC